MGFNYTRWLTSTNNDNTGRVITRNQVKTPYSSLINLQQPSTDITFYDIDPLTGNTTINIDTANSYLYDSIELYLVNIGSSKTVTFGDGFDCPPITISSNIVYKLHFNGDSFIPYLSTGGSGGTGSSGTSGSSGSSGSSGANGSSGSSGINGVDGSSGSAGSSGSSGNSYPSGNFGVSISGSGCVITTGSKGYLSIPYACTITGWTLIADQTGSIVVDVRRSTYSGFPTTVSIAGTNLPTLSAAQKATDPTLVGWGNTSIAANDIIEFVVNSASTVTAAQLIINVTKI